MEAAVLVKRVYTNWGEVPIVLGTQEVADALGVHINTIKRLVSDGELPAFKVGRVLKYHKEDVMRFAGILPPKENTRGE